MSPALIKGLIAAGGIGLGGVGIWQLSEHMAPRTLGQKLIREGFSFHAFDDSHINGWKELARAYKGNGSTDTSNRFDNFTIGSEPSETDAKTLRDRCKGAHETALGREHEARDMNRLRAWCVIRKIPTPGAST